MPRPAAVGASAGRPPCGPQRRCPLDSLPGPGAPTDDAHDDITDTLRLQPVLDHDDQRGDGADRVRHRLIGPCCHGLTPWMRARLGRRSPMPVSAPTAFFREAAPLAAAT